MTKTNVLFHKKNTRRLLMVIGAILLALILWPILKHLGYQSGDETVADKVYEWRNKLKLEELEKTSKLPRGLLSAVMHQESAGNPNAQSHAGAQGLFQFMRATANDMGLEDRTHPDNSARAASEYLSKLYFRYNQNLELTLAAYNWGLGNVDQYIKPRPNGSLFEQFRLTRMPEETQNYVTRIKMLRTTYYLR